MDATSGLHQETLGGAINIGNLRNWLGLNNLKILKYLPPSIATALGHLDQDQNNLQLTKPDFKIISPMKYELDIEEDKYFYPIMDSVKTHKVSKKIIPFNTESKCFNELIGAFPHK